MGAYEKGLAGENAARAYLERTGMRFLQARYRSQAGEIDLIMEKGGMIVFVEVKSRPLGRSGQGLEAVTPLKQKRLLKAAAAYLVKNGLWERPIRFDVVEVTLDGVRHVENAFEGQAWTV